MASVTAPGIDTAGLEAFRSPLGIREALPADRPAALELQRAAFDLPGDGPPPHPGTREELRVLVEEDRVVSCLTVIHADLCMHGAQVSMGGIRHVATHPAEQNRGFASALLRNTLLEMRRRGVLTSVLFPFSFRYYRKFGYELGGNYCHFWCRPNCIPAYSERRDCRVTSPADLPHLSRFYSDRIRASACSMARDLERWKKLDQDTELKTLVVGAGPIGGYALVSEGRDNYGGRILRVLDMDAEGPAAWRALLGHLSQFNGESVEWHARSTDLAASGLLRSPAPLREGYKPRGIATVRPMFQLRVIDVEAAVAARINTFPADRYRLALRIRDELLPENGRAITVRCQGHGPSIRPARADDPALEADIQVFSQIYCGYMSASEAVSQGLAQCSSPAALEAADALFRCGDPFISELDRF